VIFAIFGCGAHLTVNCDEMAGDRPRQSMNRNCMTWTVAHLVSITLNYLLKLATKHTI